MKISKGSSVHYKVSFDIPVNDVFNKIKIVNTFAFPAGLNSRSNMLVYIDGVIHWFLGLDRDDVVHESLGYECSVTLSENIVKTDKVKRIEIVTIAEVIDLDLLLKAVAEGKPNPENLDESIPLENIITIIGLGSKDKILFEEEVREEAKFEKYNIFGSGSGDTVRKTGGN